jgi:hypothetical protein
MTWLVNGVQRRIRADAQTLTGHPMLNPANPFTLFHHAVDVDVVPPCSTWSPALQQLIREGQRMPRDAMHHKDSELGVCFLDSGVRHAQSVISLASIHTHFLNPGSMWDLGSGIPR